MFFKTSYVAAVLLVLLLASCSGSSSPGSSFLGHEGSHGSPNMESVSVEIAAAPAPSGVQPRLWEELKAALLASVEQHRVAVAPTGEANQVTDLVLVEDTGADWQLSWSYLNTGDYDLNSEVNVADLTPIGLNYGATPLSENWQLAQAADGDGNGEVNISDISHIGQHYGAVIAGFEIQGSDSGYGPWTLIDTYMLDSPPADITTPVTYVLPSKDYDYYRVIPVDAASEDGEPSWPSLTALQPPQVELGSSMEVVTHTVTPLGGSILGSGVLDGVMVSFPADAVGNDVEVSLGYYDGTVTPNSGTMEGPILDLSTDPQIVFNEPVIITVPFTGDDEVVPILYDIAADGSLAPLLLEDVDFEANEARFLTWHCSPKVLLKGKADTLTAEQFTSMGRRFNPATDGFQITNKGSRWYSKGECWGMTSFSMWYFQQQKAFEHGSLFTNFMQPLEGGVFAQDVIATRAFTSISTQWKPFYKKQWDKRKQLSPLKNLIMIRDAMRESCGPVLLGLEFHDQKATHSVLATSMQPDPNDSKRVRINIYDPNYPGKERYLQFVSYWHNFADGGVQSWVIFEPTDKFVDHVVLDGWGSLFLGESFQAILDDALLTPPFGGNQEATITLASHTDEQQVNQRHQVLSGTVQSSEYLVNSVAVFLESPHTLFKPAGDAELLADDSFEIPIDLDPGDNRITFSVAFEDKDGILRDADPVIAGLGGRNDIRLVFDQEPAQIDLTSPTDGMTPTSLIIDVSGTIAGGDLPADVIRIRSGFEEVDIPVADGSFNGMLKIDPGYNWVELYALDLAEPGSPLKDNVIASNMDGKVLEVIYEIPPAHLTLTTPEPGAEVGRSVVLEGNIVGHQDYELEQLVIDSFTPTGLDGALEYRDSTGYNFAGGGNDFIAELPLNKGENTVFFKLLGSFPVLNDDLVNIPLTYTPGEISLTGLHLKADYTPYALRIKVEWPFRDQWPRYGTEPWVDGYSDDHFAIRLREPGGAERGTSGPAGTVGSFGQDYHENRYLTYTLSYGQYENFLQEYGSPFEIAFNIVYVQYDRVTVHQTEPTDGYSQSFVVNYTEYEGDAWEAELNAGIGTLASPRSVEYDNWPFDVSHPSVSPTYVIPLDDRAIRE